MNLAQIIAAKAAEVEQASVALANAEQRYRSVKALGGQNGYSVNIGGLQVNVARMNSAYMPQIIRGCEMIHLGALKALAGDIDQCAKALTLRKQELAELGRKLAESVGGAS